MSSRIEYRAIALDVDDPDDPYVGPTCEDAHTAHLGLADWWTIGNRPVVVEMRTITETDWERL